MKVLITDATTHRILDGEVEVVPNYAPSIETATHTWFSGDTISKKVFGNDKLWKQFIEDGIIVK